MNIPRLPPLSRFQVGDIVKIVGYGNNKFIITNVDITGKSYILKPKLFDDGRRWNQLENNLR